MKHFIIPDAQVKPGIDFGYLSCIGRYIVEKQPEVIVNIGDWADMESLSSYEVGKKSFEGRRYKADLEASHEAMKTLLLPMWEYNERQRKNGKKQYKPRMVLTYGNHEERIDRVVNGDPKLDGTIGIDDLGYKGYGWEVHPYLDVVVIDGVAYSHYFTSGSMGRPVTSPTALLNKKHMSAVMGHVQDRGIAYARRADGREITGLFCGICYEYDMEYLGGQGNNSWRGVWMLHGVRDGEFDAMSVSLKYLKEKYNERN